MLNLNNVDLEERKGEANGKRWSGIVYTATNDRGEWVGTPIKSSALTPKSGMKFLEKQIAKNDADIKSEQLKGPIRGTIARAMHCARHSPRPTASAKACSEFWAICWDSPATSPYRKTSSKPCGRAFRASGSVARNRVFLLCEMCVYNVDTITGQYPAEEYRKPM